MFLDSPMKPSRVRFLNNLPDHQSINKTRMFEMDLEAFDL